MAGNPQQIAIGNEPGGHTPAVSTVQNTPENRIGQWIALTTRDLHNVWLFLLDTLSQPRQRLGGVSEVMPLPLVFCSSGVADLAVENTCFSGLMLTDNTFRPSGSTLTCSYCL